jgi:hypothetical protein
MSTYGSVGALAGNCQGHPAQSKFESIEFGVPDRSRLISRDEISPAERGATVRSATQVGPTRRRSRLWAWIPGHAGPWPGLTNAAVERTVAGGHDELRPRFRPVPVPRRSPSCVGPRPASLAASPLRVPGRVTTAGGPAPACPSSGSGDLRIARGIFVARTRLLHIPSITSSCSLEPSPRPSSGERVVTSNIGSLLRTRVMTAGLLVVSLLAPQSAGG